MEKLAILMASSAPIGPYKNFSVKTKSANVLMVVEEDRTLSFSVQIDGFDPIPLSNGRMVDFEVEWMEKKTTSVDGYIPIKCHKVDKPMSL